MSFPWALLQVEHEGERLVYALHLVHGQGADLLREAIQVHGATWSHMTRVSLSAMRTAGRKLVGRALVLVKATIHVLKESQSGCSTTAYRRPRCS